MAVDPIRRCCYLTEDDPRGRLYRFVPDRWPDLSRGVLQAAAVSSDVVRWVDVSAAVPDRSATTAAFDGGEGVALDGDGLVFTTKGDHRVWEIDLRTDRLSVLYDARVETDQPLSHVDNVVVHPTTGALYVAEDGGDMELCQVRRGPDGPEARAVVRFAGHDGSEVTGPAFSPDGRHLYVSSQRGTDGRGVTVRVSGPWDRWSWPIDTPATASRQAVRGRAVGLEP